MIDTVMIRLKSLSLLIISTLLISCGDQPSSDNEKAEGVLANKIIDQKTTTAVGDIDRGSKLYLQCRACHSLKENEPHTIGPNLFNLVGSKAGSRDGYVYSEALLNSEIVWTIENLNLWLEKPYVIAPGNKMVFSGMRKQEDRDDLIAFLYDQTSEK